MRELRRCSRATAAASGSVAESSSVMVGIFHAAPEVEGESKEGEEGACTHTHTQTHMHIHTWIISISVKSRSRQHFGMQACWMHSEAAEGLQPRHDAL